MSRTARIAPKEYVYHILARGNNRQDVFKDEKDYGSTKGQVYTGCPRIGILANIRVISPLISIPDFLNFAFSDSLYTLDKLVGLSNKEEPDIVKCVDLTLTLLFRPDLDFTIGHNRG